MLRKIKISLLTTIMLLSVFSFASAEDMQGNIYDVVTEYVSSASNYNSTADTYIQMITESMPYFNFAFNDNGDFGAVFSVFEGAAYFIGSAGSSDATIIPYFISRSFPAIPSAVFDNTLYSTIGGKNCFGAGIFVYNDQLNIKLLSYDLYSFTNNYNGRNYTYDQWVNGSHSSDYTTVNYRFTFYSSPNQPYLIFGDSSITATLNFNVSNFYTNGLPFMRETNNLYTVYPPNNFIQVSAVEDDRLDIYSLKSSNGTNNLIVDVSAFRGNYSPAAAKTFSDVTLTLDLDGTEQEFVIPAASSNVTDSWSYDLNLYSISTSYSFFGVDNYDNVTIVKAAFSMTTSSPGGSSTENFNILCNYSMKYTPDPLAPEEIPSPDYKDTEVKTDSELEDMKSELHEQSSKFSFINGTWNFIPEADLPTFPGWANVYTNYVWFADGNSDTTYRGKWYQMANNIPSIADLSRPFDPAAWVENNLTWAYYDVVLLKVYTVNVGFNDPLAVIGNYSLSGYLVFISDRYYDHYQIENQLDLFKLIKYTGDNDVLFFDYMRNKLDDFESKSLTGISSIIDINNNGVSWLQTINNKCVTLDNSLTSGFTSVVSAIENIPQPVPFDDTNILAAVNNGFSNLQSRMTYLFVPSFSWQSVNYTEYLDSLGILSVPFRFGSQALNGLENNYSSNFEFTIAAFNMPLPQGGSFQLWDQQEVDFNIVEAGLPGSLWSNLQNFFFWICIIGQAYYTYCHIFREKGGEDLDI